MKILGITIGIVLLLVLVGGGVFLLSTMSKDEDVVNTSNTNTTVNTNATVANTNSGPGTTVVVYQKPSDYPEDVFYPSDATVSSVDTTGEKTRIGVSIPLGGLNVQNALESTMGENGWTRSSHVISDNGTTYTSSWTKNSRLVILNMSYLPKEDGSVTLIEITY